MTSDEKLNKLCRVYIDVSTRYQEAVISKKSHDEVSKLKTELNILEDEIQILMTQLGYMDENS